MLVDILIEVMAEGTPFYSAICRLEGISAEEACRHPEVVEFFADCLLEVRRIALSN